MQKILTIVICISTLATAEIDIKTMMDKAKDAVADINVTQVLEKAKDAVNDINVTEAVNKAKDAVADINVTEMMNKAKKAVADINVSDMVEKVKDAVDTEFSWEASLPDAIEQAKIKDKRIMVMVEGEHCRWCKKMLHRTIADDTVQKRLAEGYVSVRVQREDLETMKNLPEVRGVPTIFFMDQDRNVIEEVIGYFDVLDFTSYMNDVDKKMAQKEHTLQTGK